MTSPSPAPRSKGAACAAAWDADGSSDLLLDELLAEVPNETDALLVELLEQQPGSLAFETQLLTGEINRSSAGEREHRNTPHIHDAANPQHSREEHFTPSTSHSKAKQTLHSLRVEVNQLTSHLKRLQDDCNIPQHPHVRSAMERATTERLKRRRVEDECRQLRAAVYAQTQFIRGLRSVFSGSAPLSLTAMDLSHYLHNYTRLPRDRSTRWSEYAALAQEARLESAIDILCRETKAMSLATSRMTDFVGCEALATEASPSLDPRFSQTELLNYYDGFGLTSTSVYALETNDIGAALRGLCVAARDIMIKTRFYECTGLKRQIVDPDALPGSSSYSNVHCHITGVVPSESPVADELSIESRVVTLYKQTADYAVLFWDYVDDDELHPVRETTDITREAVGACFIRREICDDGVERAVCRGMRTRRYRFHGHTSQDALKRFESVVTRVMKKSDMVFRGIALDAIAQEQAAYAQAVARLGER